MEGMMQGMMEQMQGMMGRRGMTQEGDEEEAPRGGMMGRGGMMAQGGMICATQPTASRW
jgi:hypothetical protein